MMGLLNDPLMQLQMKKKRLRPKRKQKVIYPTSVEVEYRRKINKVLNRLRQLVNRELAPDIQSYVVQAQQFRPDGAEVRTDAYIGKLLGTIDKIRMQVLEEFPDSRLKSEAAEAADRVSGHNRRQVQGLVKNVVGLDVILSEPYLAEQIEDFAQWNAKLIKDMSEEYLNRVQNTVVSGVQGGLRASEIEKQLPKSAKVSKSRAKMIARDQVAKLTGQLNRLRQEELGLNKYIWRTMRDERVRANHAVLEGEEFSWDNPPDVGHPGEDYQCRCYAEPVIDLGD